jgi:hypothetical protein
MSRFFTVLFLIAIFSLNAFAESVTVQTAKQVGLSFLTKPVTTTGILKIKKHKPDLELVYMADAVKVSYANQSSQNATQAVMPFYVFNTENEGYVIVAGDDRAIPVLGYASEGTFDPNNIPQNMQKWLEGYKAEIRYAVENEIEASADTREQWNALLTNQSAKLPSQANAVSP